MQGRAAAGLSTALGDPIKYNRTDSQGGGYSCIMQRAVLIPPNKTLALPQSHFYQPNLLRRLPPFHPLLCPFLWPPCLFSSLLLSCLSPCSLTLQAPLPFLVNSTICSPAHKLHLSFISNDWWARSHPIALALGGGWGGAKGRVLQYGPEGPAISGQTPTSPEKPAGRKLMCPPPPAHPLVSISS